jgi:hypothetical protein
LRTDGTIYTYHEYDFYRFNDIEIVDNKIYASEAFAPRMYRVDPLTGDLELIIDDWSLYYFYDLAFDGNYFYVDEWDLNRYDVLGNKAGTAAFDETVFGSTYDGTYLWILDEFAQIRCWDIGAWPSIAELIDNSFPAPTEFCRGLWFDGTHFWTAESIDGTLGHIYRFEYGGRIVAQWDEPAFNGWAAGLILANNPPDIPGNPIPADNAIKIPVATTLAWNSSDQDGDSLFYNVYLDTAIPPVLVSLLQPDTAFDPDGELANGREYYWQIIAYDIHGDSAVGQIWSFTTQTSYICGDANSDQTVNVGDAVYLIAYVFAGGLPPSPEEAGDANCDGEVNVGDSVYLIAYVFDGGEEPCCP